MITQSMLDQAYLRCARVYGEGKNDYFAPLYLQELFKIPFENRATQVAFGGNDIGLDAFHISKTAGNLHLYQFKWAKNHMLFADLIKAPDRRPEWTAFLATQARTSLRIRSNFSFGLPSISTSHFAISRRISNRVRPGAKVLQTRWP